MKPQQAFTLIEMLLALAIAGIIVAVVASEFNLGLNVYERSRYDSALQAQKIMEVLLRDLSSAWPFSSPASGAVFQGKASSLSFVTAERLGFAMHEAGSSALKKVEFSLAPAAGAARTLMYKRYDFPVSAAGTTVARDLSSLVESVHFQYYDGKQWQKAWGSSLGLPQAVKVVLALYKKPAAVSREIFSTVIEIPCAR